MASRTDAKNQRVEYSYDVHQRVTQIRRYNSGQQNEDSNQRVDLYYDTNPFDAAFTQNGWGRPVAAVYKWYSPSLQVLTTITEMYSYTVGGRMTKKRMRVLRGSNQKDIDAIYTYDNEGKMTSVQYPGKGLPPNGSGPATYTYSYTYDAMGRSSGWTERWVNSSWDITSTIASSTVYGAGGELRSVNYFDNTETREYNNLLQLTRVTAAGTAGWPGLNVNLEYRYSGTQNNGRITQMKDWVSGEEVSYSYDALNRLMTAVTTGPEWGNSYSYDGFGNLKTKTVTKGSAPALSIGIDPGTNRVVGQSYDANGNPISLGTYDVENRLVSSGQEEYAYGPGNERVWRRYWNGTGYQEDVYFYGVDGRKLATFAMNSGLSDQQTDTNVYFAGRLIKAQGKTVVLDRLGSVRVARGNPIESFDYYPYGEEKLGATGQGREKFGTYYRDSTGLDYAMNRYYNSAQGRFLTPDPYQATAEGNGNLEEPASWNRYAYVEGDPVNFNDPSGLIKAVLVHSDGIDLGISWWLQFRRDPNTRAPVGIRRRNSEIAEEKLDAVKGDLQRATEDSIFKAEHLECISGIETGRTWNPNISAANGRAGLFQFNKTNWEASGTSIPWGDGTAARDPYASAAVAVGFLYRKLGYCGQANPTPEAIQKAIDNFGEGDSRYGQYVMECARQLERGNFQSAHAVLYQYARWVQSGRP